MTNLSRRSLLTGLAHYAGKPIAEMTREDLIEALSQASSELRQLRNSDEIRARALGRVEMMRRGEI